TFFQIVSAPQAIFLAFLRLFLLAWLADGQVVLSGPGTASAWSPERAAPPQRGGNKKRGGMKRGNTKKRTGHAREGERAWYGARWSFAYDCWTRRHTLRRAPQQTPPSWARESLGGGHGALRALVRRATPRGPAPGAPTPR